MSEQQENQVEQTATTAEVSTTMPTIIYVLYLANLLIPFTAPAPRALQSKSGPLVIASFPESEGAVARRAVGLWYSIFLRTR